MARTGRVSDGVASDWLDDLILRSPYLGLMTADPYGVVDPLTVEIAAPAYGRIPVDWLKSGRLLRNVDQLVWVGIPSGATVAYITGWDAAFNGIMSFAVPYGPVLYSAAGGLIIPTEDFFVGIDA